MSDSTSDQTIVSEASSLDLFKQRQIMREYERQQRSRLVRKLALLLALLCGTLTLAEAVFFILSGLLLAEPFGAALGLGASLLATGLLGIGYWAARQQNINLAMILVIGIGLAASLAMSFSGNIFRDTLTIQPLLAFFFLNIGIIIVGLLGNLRMILGTTIGINGYTLAALLLFPDYFTHQPSVTATSAITLLLLLTMQWCTAALMGAGRLNMQQTFRDVSEAQLAIEHARQLDELKDQFISSVNHELRNPMMAMMNYVTVLNRRHDLMTAERRSQILGSLDETGKRIVHLVGSILDTRNLAEHPEDFEPHAISINGTLMIAASLLDPIEACMEERELHIHIPAQLEVWGSEIYLQQIFTNLLSNAVKYSEPGTRIEVQAKVVPHAGGARGVNSLKPRMVEISVHDHGLGIPPDQIPLLFNRFVRLPRDMTSSTMGNGLGLYLCRVLTEAMGGRIWVESTGFEGEGATFHLQLPTVPTESAEQEKGLPTAVGHRAPAPSFAALRVGRIRIAIGATLALLLALSATLAVLQNRPTPVPAITGTVQYIDGLAGAFSGVSLHINRLPAPPAGAHYHAWIIDTSNEQILSLGDMVADHQTFALTYPGTAVGRNLLGAGNLIEVTLERSTSDVPLGNIVASGVFPTKAFVHISHLLYSFPATPAKIGLLIGLRSQIELLDSHAHQLTSAVSQYPDTTPCLVQSMMNIIEGTKGSDYQAPSAACAPLGLDDGDGFGLLASSATVTSGYLLDASDHAALAIQQPDATAMLHVHGGRLITAIDNISQQVTLMKGDLLALLKGPASASLLASVITLADNADYGIGETANENATTNMKPSLGGVQFAYAEGHALAELQLFSATH